jgi:hypothetical protein
MCKHVHVFQKTPIENIEVCRCGCKLRIEDIKKFEFRVSKFPEIYTILTEDTWKKFQEEFNTIFLYVNKKTKEN